MQIIKTRRGDYVETLSRRNWLLFAVVLCDLIVFIFCSRLLVLACLETGEKLDQDPGEGLLKVAGRKISQVNAYAGAKLDELGKDKFIKLSLATAETKDKIVFTPQPSAKLSRKPSAKLSVGSTPAKPKTKPVADKTKDKTQDKTIVVSSTDNPQDKTKIIYGGKQYSLDQFAEKLRKWYKRGKEASRQSTAESNLKKYQDGKEQTDNLLIFKEGAKTVKISKR